MLPESSASNNDQRVSDFARLLLESRKRLHAFILTLVPNWDDADELEQRTAIILWQKFGEYVPGTNFFSWACQIARLEVNNYRRTQGRSRLYFSNELVTALAELRCDDESAYQDRRAALASCLQKLPPTEGDLIERCYGRKVVTAKEVAGSMGRPASTVYKALARIRHRLLQCIERELSSRGRP